MKKTIVAALFALAGTSASAAPVSGFNNVVDNGGGSYTFIFDTVASDIIGNSDGIIFAGGGINITATSAQGRVIQDHPANGGLGVLSKAGPSDNLELSEGETLSLKFSQAVDIVGWTLNGLLGQNGHQDAADGRFGVAIDGSFVASSSASNWDGVGSDTVPGNFPSICGVQSTFCGVSDFALVTPRGSLPPFKGYLESITIQVAAVPVPAAMPLMIGALGGLAFAARRRRRAA